jgi:glycosyltransferase involved in cell wall biosynthesis
MGAYWSFAMNALDALLARAQPGYEIAAQGVAASLRANIGAGSFERIEAEQLGDVVAAALERKPAIPGESASAVTIRDLSFLEWSCGLAVDDQAKRRLALLLRRDYRLQVEAAGLKRAKPDVAARRSHVVFVGTLGSPLHSPSIGAVGYLRALAADPKNRRIQVYHNGPIDPALGEHIRETLPAAISFHQVEHHPDYLAMALMRLPCSFHFWCFPRPNIDYSFLAMFGPTVMFTCADDAPVQYADVYWSCRPPEHIESVWSAAPQGFRANYTRSRAADFQRVPAVRIRSKADLGIPDDDLLIATIGNRLGVDLDEPFITGVEKALRARPRCRWLVVGLLPDWLRDAMRQVLGPRFLHVPHDLDLAGLMGAADLCLNPFRRGGGNSAIIAAAAGAPVLTRGDIGDVGACVPAEHAAMGADDYFARLDRLLDDADERAAWSRIQRDFIEAWLDPALYASELDRMVALAFKRFQARAGRSLEVVFPNADIAAAA